jgi:hypothetical protein
MHGTNIPARDSGQATPERKLDETARSEQELGSWIQIGVPALKILAALQKQRAEPRP